MNLRTIGAAAVIAAMALPMAAGAEQGLIYVTPSAGSINFDEHTNLETEAVWQLGGEYMFTDHLSAELGYGFSDPNIDGTKQEVDVDHLFLNGYYYFGERTGLQPYVSLGLGHAEFDTSGFDSKETTASAGVGVRLHFTDRVSLRVDARGINSIDEGDIHEQYTVGLSYAFGGKQPAPAPVAAPEPAPAPAAPPRLDSDGDGVYDDEDLCPGTPAGARVNSKGCEVLTQQRIEERLQVNFPTNSAVVQPQDMAEIDRVADFMKKYPEVSTQIEGHTDSDGAEAYNQDLSQRRADAVREVLVQRFGVDPSRLTAVGYGESRPTASNATAQGKAENRRVVAVLSVIETK